MQLNTTTLFATTLISAVIGFGLAFFIERKLSSRMQKKSQKILTLIAMTSFGYGLMATLNEVIGFPLQGLHIRYDKLVGIVVANMLFLPIVLLVIAKLIGLNNKAVDVNFGVQSNLVAGSFLKYILMLAGALAVAYFGYVALKEDATTPTAATYDFYYKVDPENCNSPYEVNPTSSVSFLLKKETGEIFMTSERDDNGVKKKNIKKLDNCSVLDSKNWTCGGGSGDFTPPKYMFIDGDFEFEELVFKDLKFCNARIVKR